MVTDQRGEIEPESELGVFSGDTRFVSSYHLYLNGEPWQLLGSAQVHYYTAQLHFMSPQVATDDGEIRPGDLGLTILRRVGDGIHEDLDIASYAPAPVRFQLEIAVSADFADIHEVRANQFVRRGLLRTTWDDVRGELATAYPEPRLRARAPLPSH
jgi:hypothetical protein